MANARGQRDWRVPQHDSYGRDSAGVYGMLPVMLESMGCELQTFSDLNDANLQSADVLLLLNPDQTLSAQQQANIWEYVRGGGTLLVVTEGFTPESGLAGITDALLEPVDMQFARDAAISETGNWQGATLAMQHAATSASFLPTARFLSDNGASIHMGWRARPLVVGRWGWSAPEQGAAWRGNQRFQVGQKLGDLVLVAEQRVGRGSVVLLGDNVSLTNEGLVQGYDFAVNLLSYLANRTAGPQTPWRQVAGFICCLGILVLLARSLSVRHLLTVALGLALSIAACSVMNHRHSGIIPDGRKISSLGPATVENHLAYIDAAHLEPYLLDEWGFDSLNGLALNLMRNGYLPLLLHEWRPDQLDQAGLLISIAPRTVSLHGSVKWPGGLSKGGAFSSVPSARNRLTRVQRCSPTSVCVFLRHPCRPWETGRSPSRLVA